MSEEIKYEILRKEGRKKRTKLTVAIDRTSIKFSDDLTDKQEQHIIEFANLIADEIRKDFKSTMRGRLDKDFSLNIIKMRMGEGKNKEYRDFDFEELKEKS